jgi:hypothetical protein
MIQKVDPRVVKTYQVRAQPNLYRFGTALNCGEQVHLIYLYFLFKQTYRHIF